MVSHVYAIIRPVYSYDFGVKSTVFRCFLQLYAGLVKKFFFFFFSGVVYCFNTAWIKVFPADSISGGKTTMTEKQERQPHETDEEKCLLWKMPSNKQTNKTKKSKNKNPHHEQQRAV